MPNYAFKCEGCDYTFDEGMSVATFAARKADEHNGFRFKTCGRCRRKGRIVHDALRQYQSQSPPQMDSFTFYENAPETILKGQRQLTVTKTEAKRLLKEHGLAESGRAAKQKRKSAKVIDKGAIADKWAERYGEFSHGPAAPQAEPKKALISKNGKAVNPLAAGPILVEEPPPPRVLPWDRKVEDDGSGARRVNPKDYQPPKVVDIMRDPSLTMVAKWGTLKKVAKRLGLKPPTTTKRPEMERLVLDRFREREQAAAK